MGAKGMLAPVSCKIYLVLSYKNIQMGFLAETATEKRYVYHSISPPSWQGKLYVYCIYVIAKRILPVTIIKKTHNAILSHIVCLFLNPHTNQAKTNSGIPFSQ